MKVTYKIRTTSGNKESITIDPCNLEQLTALFENELIGEILLTREVLPPQQSHYLKTVQPYFSEVEKGTKTFEVRTNDRNFQVGDEVYLREYDLDTNSYSGKQVRATITYVLNDFSLLYLTTCVFSFKVNQISNKPLESEQSNINSILTPIDWLLENMPQISQYIPLAISLELHSKVRIAKQMEQDIIKANTLHQDSSTEPLIDKVKAFNQEIDSKAMKEIHNILYSTARKAKEIIDSYSSVRRIAIQASKEYQPIPNTTTK